MRPRELSTACRSAPRSRCCHRPSWTSRVHEVRRHQQKDGADKRRDLSHRLGATGGHRHHDDSEQSTNADVDAVVVAQPERHDDGDGKLEHTRQRRAIRVAPHRQETGRIGENLRVAVRARHHHDFDRDDEERDPPRSGQTPRGVEREHGRQREHRGNEQGLAEERRVGKQPERNRRQRLHQWQSHLHVVARRPLAHRDLLAHRDSARSGRC